MSATTSVQCPSCQARLKVKDTSTLGKTIKCPKCHEPFVAKAPATDDKPAPAEEKRRRPKGAKAGNQTDGQPTTPQKKKKKKKKGKKPAGASWTLPVLVGGGVLLVLGLTLFIAWTVVSGRRGTTSKPKAPLTFANYNQSTGAFQCDYPKGWKMSHGGREGRFWAKFESGSASIRVQESLVGSVTGGSVDRSEDNEYSAVHGLHEQKKRLFAEDNDGCKEEPPEIVKCPFGQARRSEFTIPGFLGDEKGYRTTALGSTRQIDIICRCPKSQWESLKPVFATTIESLKLGIRQ